MTDICNVWIIDDDSSIRWVLERALKKCNFQVTTFATSVGILDRLQHITMLPDVILTDIRMPELDGISLLQQLTVRYPQLPVIIMTAYSDLESAVAAFHGGAFEYLPKPFDIDHVVEKVQRACYKQLTKNEEKKLEEKERIVETISSSEIIGVAPSMQEVFRAIGRLSRSTVAVLITGETGTGKELVANALHKNSPRAKAPFIAINVAAIPKDLLESELFGHERGAFTGAQQRREGRFEQAHGGTLFLDEIGDMPIELGTRLLRVLAEGKFYRVGGNEPIKVDVRIIAATHQNLENLVQEGRFREDLYHRLNVIRIRLPALRQRQEDIPILMRHFLIQAAKELGVKTKSLLPKTVDILKQLPWQGNVRQLKNTALWLTVMASSQKIHPQDLPPELVEKSLTTSNFKDDWQTALRQWAKARFQAGQVEILNTAIPAFEAIMIETALQYTNGHKIEAAKCLGWGRNTLTRKIKEFNLE